MFKKNDRKSNEPEMNNVQAETKAESGSEKSAASKAEQDLPSKLGSDRPSLPDRPLSRIAKHQTADAELGPADTTSASSEKKAADKPENNEPEKELFNPFYNYHKRKFPVWQRLVALISLSALAVVVGAMIGYGLLGHGNPFAVFNWHTWQHIIDFVKKD